jgi:hypothetical protein
MTHLLNVEILKIFLDPVTLTANIFPLKILYTATREMPAGLDISNFNVIKRHLKISMIQACYEHYSRK